MHGFMLYTCHRSKEGIGDRWIPGTPRLRSDGNKIVMDRVNLECEEVHTYLLDFD